jgi:hypothetical protein
MGLIELLPLAVVFGLGGLLIWVLSRVGRRVRNQALRASPAVSEQEVQTGSLQPTRDSSNALLNVLFIPGGWKRELGLCILVGLALIGLTSLSTGGVGVLVWMTRGIVAGVTIFVILKAVGA